MNRVCDGNDPGLLGTDLKPCTCGLEFDDMGYSVLYPHLPRARPLTEKEREEMLAYLGVTSG